MKRKIGVLTSLLFLVCVVLTGCTEADKVSSNISQEANNFNVTRRLTVINARTDTVLLELIGTFSLKNNDSNELEVICEVDDGKYQKHFVYLNEYTLYVVEDARRMLAELAQKERVEGTGHGDGTVEN